jgi:hypothetical protein
MCEWRGGLHGTGGSCACKGNERKIGLLVNVIDQTPIPIISNSLRLRGIVSSNAAMANRSDAIVAELRKRGLG